MRISQHTSMPVRLAYAPVAALLALGLAGAFTAPGARLDAQTTPPDSARVAPTASTVKKSGPYVLQPPPANFTPPSLSIADPQYDWGTVLQGEIVEHSYELENTGGAPLKVERVKPSCGCTTVNFTSVIPPGKTGNITLKVDTSRFTGSVRKTADVLTSADRQPARLTIGGKIEAALSIEPKLPRMDIVWGAEPEPIVVTLRRASSHTIKVTGIEPKTDVVTASLNEVTPGEEYHLTVKANLPESERKYYYAQIDVSLDVEGKTLTIPVRVSITVKQRVEAAPVSVYFTTRDTSSVKAPGSAPITKSVDVKTLVPGHTFDVMGVESDGDLFKTSIEPVVKGSHYKLHVTLAGWPADNARRAVERITVKTSDEKVPTVRVTATASFATGFSRPARSVTPPTRRPAPSTTGTGSSTK